MGRDWSHGLEEKKLR
ncbi:Protein CBG27725 [Caenorhabditis briggsae]|uniref:Protein CBG27725 n=1 Tax=Caenorhabditis briggsae TaxID=6238 RepID=B6IJ23_CAEBR|nr:Protein CBG27725 [Caenorhabditis briggsae]CAS00003.1 Protein CBG27725 [Caenorhabditis briggsae]